MQEERILTEMESSMLRTIFQSKEQRHLLYVARVLTAFRWIGEQTCKLASDDACKQFTVLLRGLASLFSLTSRSVVLWSNTGGLNGATIAKLN